MSGSSEIRVTMPVRSFGAVPRVMRAATPWHVVQGREIGPLARFVDWFRHDTALRRSRRALLDLTDEQLHDVGLTRAQALAEAGRSSYLD